MRKFDFDFGMHLLAYEIARLELKGTLVAAAVALVAVALVAVVFCCFVLVCHICF